MRVFAATIPATAPSRRTTPAAWIPESLPDDQLRALALAGVEAARAAGADFADIRIGVQRGISVSAHPQLPMVSLACGYGVRAWIDGTWSFQHGNVMTPESVAMTARGAVAGARRNAATNGRLAAYRTSLLAKGMRDVTSAWAAAPAVTGEWTMPVEIDPFTVPIDDYHRILGSLANPLAPATVYAAAIARAQLLEWHGETRIFASSDGSLVTQRRMTGGVQLSSVSRLIGEVPPTDIELRDDTLSALCGGFESVLRPAPLAALEPLYDAVVRWHELPAVRFDDVGRFPVVLDGKTSAALIGTTLDAALDGDRVAGFESDAAGDSFLSPAEDILRAEAPQLSPLLSMHANRALPSPTAVQWDDDGVTPEPYTLVDRGRVVDFHTTRESAPMMTEWYASRGKPLRSHGTSVASNPTDVPRGTGGHLTVSAATGRTTLDALVRELDHGFLVVHGAVYSTPGLSAGTVRLDPYDGVVLEIRRGVPVARVAPKLEFKTVSALGKNLLALGDASTVNTTNVGAMKGIPWTESIQRITAPAMLCKDFDITLLT